MHSGSLIGKLININFFAFQQKLYDLRVAFSNSQLQCGPAVLGYPVNIDILADKPLDNLFLSFEACAMQGIPSGVAQLI